MTRVLIAADIRLYREGLAQILSGHDNIGVVGATASAQETLAAVPGTHPDVVLLDMAMPESLTVVRVLADAEPAVKVVALAVAESEQDVIACAEAGVAGYVLREGSLGDLLATVESVSRGEAICSPRMTATLLRRLALLAGGRPQTPLTARELEIVRLVDQGLSNKDIARRLCIEVATVKNHVHNVLEKLQVHRRGEAAARLRKLVPRRTQESQAEA